MSYLRASAGTGDFGKLADFVLPKVRHSIWYANLDEDEELNLETPSCSAAFPGVVIRRRMEEVESDDSNDLKEMLPQVGAACYDYVAMEEDELSFHRGSVVEIIETDREEGWVYGKIDDKEGMVPENYVSLIGRQPQEIKASEFERHESLGDGGSCDVFKGTYRGQKVALKVPKRRRPLENQSLEELKREALVFARLNHKNIVAFHGICTESPCILLELCEGGSLRQLYRRLSFSVYSTVIAWALQIAEGMNHLHNRDDAMIHADLKADNILIKELPCICEHNEESAQLEPPLYQNGVCSRCSGTRLDKLTLKISDFGISRDVTSSRHSLVGSVPWMSPEVIIKSEYSKSSDVWSFGILLWEILTNQLPFPGSKYPSELLMLVIGECKETPDIPENCPPQIRRIMRKCWEIQPENRPSFSEMIAMLNEASADIEKYHGLYNFDCVKKSTARMDVTFNEIAEEFKRRLINASSYVNRQFKPKAPKPAKRKAQTKSTLPKGKVLKETIGGPQGFQHTLRISAAEPKSQRFHIFENPDLKVYLRPIRVTRQASKSEPELSASTANTRQFARRSNNGTHKDLKKSKKKARKANSSDSLNVTTPRDINTPSFRRSDNGRKSNSVFYDLKDSDFSRSSFPDSERKQRGLSKLFNILKRSSSSANLNEIVDLSPDQEIKEDDINASGHVDSPLSSGCQTPCEQSPSPKTAYNSPLKVDMANIFDFDLAEIEKAASLPFTNKTYQTMTECIRKPETLQAPETLKPRSSSAEPPRAVPKLPPRPPHLPPRIQNPRASSSRSRNSSTASWESEFGEPVQRRKVLGQFIHAPDGIDRPPTTYIPSLLLSTTEEGLKRPESSCIPSTLSGHDSPPTEQAPSPPALVLPYLVPRIVICPRTPPNSM